MIVALQMKVYRRWNNSPKMPALMSRGVRFTMASPFTRPLQLNRGIPLRINPDRGVEMRRSFFIGQGLGTRFHGVRDCRFQQWFQIGATRCG